MSIELISDHLLKSECVCAFTGAGVSVASGLPDFRSNDGLWEKFAPDKYGTINAFIESPEQVWDFF